MILLLIRHGESEADLLDVHEGRADFALTERGHRQAQAMAEYVAANYRIDRIYASTLTRAMQTARHLSDATCVPIRPKHDLMEFNNGLLAGLPHKEAAEKYPRVPDLPPDKSVYEQESLVEFRDRAERILTKILAEASENDTVAVVTHGGTINQLYHAFLKLPVKDGMFFSTADTGIHEWIVEQTERRVARANYDLHSNGI